MSESSSPAAQQADKGWVQIQSQTFVDDVTDEDDKEDPALKPGIVIDDPSIVAEMVAAEAEAKENAEEKVEEKNVADKGEEEDEDEVKVNCYAAILLGMKCEITVSPDEDDNGGESETAMEASPAEVEVAIEEKDIVEEMEEEKMKEEEKMEQEKMEKEKMEKEEPKEEEEEVKDKEKDIAQEKEEALNEVIPEPAKQVRKDIEELADHDNWVKEEDKVEVEKDELLEGEAESEAEAEGEAEAVEKGDDSDDSDDTEAEVEAEAEAEAEVEAEMEPVIKTTGAEGLEMEREGTTYSTTTAITDGRKKQPLPHKLPKENMFIQDNYWR